MKLPPRPKLSLRSAINKMCKECIYDDTAPGNWRVQVGACSCKSCPLYACRPTSSKEAT